MPASSDSGRVRGRINKIHMLQLRYDCHSLEMERPASFRHSVMTSFWTGTEVTGRIIYYKKQHLLYIYYYKKQHLDCRGVASVSVCGSEIQQRNENAERNRSELLGEAIDG